MFKVDATTKSLIRLISGLFLCTLVLGVLLMSQKAPFIKGLVFGTLFTLLKTLLISHICARCLEMPDAKAKVYAITHYFLRYILTMFVLLIALLEPTISFVATIIGSFLLPVAGYLLPVIEKRKLIK